MASLTFLYPMWFLALIPLGVILPWLIRQKTQQGLIAPHLAGRLGLNERQPVQGLLTWLPFVWLLSVTALAGPSWQKTTLPAYSLSGARVLVMDMSRSMYATDITPNRLTQARFKALDLLPGWIEGSTGLVTYAADGYTVSPLTKDSQTLSTLIPHLSPEILPIQGSNAAAGIQEAITLLKQAGHIQGDIILITDGLSDKESDDSLALLANTEYRVSVLAMGTTQGAPIALPDGRLQTDNSGRTVISRVDLSTLLPLTKETGGVLQLAKPTNSDVNALIAATAKPPQSTVQDKDKQELEERLNNGFWLLIPVIVIALLGFRRGVLLAACLIFIPVDQSYAADTGFAFKNRDQRAYQLFEDEQYAESAKVFSSAAWKGAAYYKAGEYDKAIETLKPLENDASQYNLGNAYVQVGQYDDAISIYERLLERNPDNQDARHNLEIARQLKANQPESPQNQANSTNKQPSDQQQDKSGNQRKQQDNPANSNDPQSEQQNADSSQEQSSQQSSEQDPGQNAGQDGQSGQHPDQQSGQQSGQQPGQPNQAQPQQSDNRQSGSQSDAENQQSDAGNAGQNTNATSGSTADAKPDDSRSASHAGSEQEADQQSDLQTAQQTVQQSEQQQTETQPDSQQAVSADEQSAENGKEQDSDAPPSVATSAAETGSNSSISASDPVLKKLEQVQDDTSGLIRAQLILQARQKQAPNASENTW
ncbi:VWA domain-containing protein [Photobacterium ganghwense]|uniref:VWA domain-containing protein n=1 Tax=Photobacterium ganghwense TaxID=320778 RepID=UPI00405659A0